ncbi:MAG: AraC family transcriptional regulator [Verrucomicrobiota bacterium]
MLQFWQHPSRLHLAVSMPRSSRRGLSLGRHSHPFHEIGFVLEGECEWHLTARRERLAAGDLLIVPAGTRHHEKTPGRAQARLGWIGFDFADGHAELPPSLSGVLATGPYRDEVRHLLTVICTERQHQKLGHAERAEFALRELLIVLCRLHSPAEVQAESPKATRVAELTRSAALTLSGNLAQPMRIRDLAHYHSLSTAHFSALFRKHQGVSPSRYLQNARLARAKTLLAEGSLNIKEIAAACGYVDAAHFCHAFKAAAGLTPKQWRHAASSPAADLSLAADPAASRPSPRPKTPRPPAPRGRARPSR